MIHRKLPIAVALGFAALLLVGFAVPRALTPAHSADDTAVTSSQAPPPVEQSAQSGAPGAQPPPPPQAMAEDVDWRGTKQKWVPILSLEQQGVRIGAAQVAGPARQVDRVKGVAQFRLDFRGFARMYVYVPVSTLTLTKLDRVQGVSVWAVGDLQLVGF